MIGTERQKAIFELLQSAALSETEVQALYQNALNPDYWRALNPDLSVGSTVVTGEEIVDSGLISPEQVALQEARFRCEGYFHTGPVIAPEVVERMRQGIERLREHRWPAVFGFIYDEFWQVAKSPSLARLVAMAMGDGFMLNSHFWAYYVAAVRGAAGFPPHMDSPENGENYLTVWIPLTDATPENGCMYVIPRDRAPETMPADFYTIKSGSGRELGRYLQAAKALPAPAGSLLGWYQTLVHWGSISSGQTTPQTSPRISIAIEFVRKDLEIRVEDRPLTGMTEMPGFEDRVRAVGRSLHAYGQVQERSLSRFRELALRMSQS